MSGWTETLSLRPYNIKTGTASIPDGTTSYAIEISPYNNSEYTVTITPRGPVTVIPYVTDMTSNSFTINGSPGNYFWTTISIS